MIMKTKRRRMLLLFHLMMNLSTWKNPPLKFQWISFLDMIHWMWFLLISNQIDFFFVFATKNKMNKVVLNQSNHTHINWSIRFNDLMIFFWKQKKIIRINDHYGKHFFLFGQWTLWMPVNQNYELMNEWWLHYITLHYSLYNEVLHNFTWLNHLAHTHTQYFTQKKPNWNDF